MALINCPECGHDVSTAAAACPNCGHPILRTAEPEVPETNGRGGAIPAEPVAIVPRYLSFGLSGTVAGFWIATAALFGMASVLALAAFGAWTAWDAGESNLIDMANADDLWWAGLGFAYLLVPVAGVLFLTWFFQAYRSALSRGATGTRWGSGWTIGSWFIPIANFVIPKLVMNEVDRMSSLDIGDPPIGESWKTSRALVSSDLWWILLLVGVATYWVGLFSYGSESGYSGQAVGIGYLIFALSAASYSAAAALCSAIVLSIGRRLRRP